MSLPSDFVESLSAVHPVTVIDRIYNRAKAGNTANTLTQWVLTNELRPIDIFCYFAARFGPPNGSLNALRADQSDNLFHWEWVCDYQNIQFRILGLTFRTEIFISGREYDDEDKKSLISQFRESFNTYGQSMGSVRKQLEPWIEFVNPYQRIRRAIDALLHDLKLLNIDMENDQIPPIYDRRPDDDYRSLWNEQAVLYSRAIGLAFGIRAMLPVLAEAFVNLLLYMLMKPELKTDSRLRDNAFRQPIDIRIRGLSHNCLGFKQPVDFTIEACKRFHTLMNERNDLLHGNVVIDKLMFNEVSFWRTIPIFHKYTTMWERSRGVYSKAAGVDKIDEECGIVDQFIDYLLSCLEDSYRPHFERLSSPYDLGIRKDTGLVGVLFPEVLVDFVTIAAKPEATE